MAAKEIGTETSLTPGPWEKVHQQLEVKVPETKVSPLGAFIESYAESMPQSIALSYYDRDISYAELNTLTNQLANALEELAIGRGDVIGIHMQNIPQYVIAFLAASKLGATVSSISPMLTPQEVATQIKDANIKVVFSLDTLAEMTLTKITELPACCTRIIICGSDDLLRPTPQKTPSIQGASCYSYLEFSKDKSSTYAQAPLAPEHIMLIQYTGGTTGPAKGAQLRLQGLMLNAEMSQVYQPWKEGEEVVASALPLFHAAGMIMLIISMRYGGRFFLIPSPRDTEHFCQQMIAHPPTRISAVPTLYQQIVAHPLCEKIDFSKLVFAMTGAAPITGDDRKKIEDKLGGVTLSDSYGMTETGPAIVANPPQKCKPEAVGIPLPGVDIRIVDVESGSKELPYGEAGEIIVNTPCVMAGYLNCPEESANALRDWQGKKWMYTGDVGVMDEEGYIYLRDRTKDMIIVSGFKVFSTEVENKLSYLECIANSALIGRPDPTRPGSEIVNLYVELSPAAKQRNEEELISEITEFCEQNLSRYKIPKAIHIIDAIPLTPVGKVNKKLLRANAHQ